LYGSGTARFLRLFGWNLWRNLPGQWLSQIRNFQIFILSLTVLLIFFYCFHLQSVAAVVVVIMAELATIAFIFVAHDKASNRNKYKDFDQTLKLLCDVANFCINQMMLVMIGSFLCLSVVLQVAIEITLIC